MYQSCNSIGDSKDAEIRGIAAAGLVLRGHNSFTSLHKLAASQNRQTHDLAQAAIVRIEMNTTTAKTSLLTHRSNAIRY
jgi:hypothetical protein